MRRCFARVEKKAAFATWMARARKAILHDVSGRLTLAQQHGEAMRVAEAATRDRSAARAVEDREQIERHAARVSEAEEEVRVLHIAPLPIGSTHCSAAICTLSPETLIETLATAVSLCCVLKVQAARLELENVKTAMRERMLAHLHAQSVHDRRHATHMLSKPHTCSASHTCSAFLSLIHVATRLQHCPMRLYSACARSPSLVASLCVSPPLHRFTVARQVRRQRVAGMLHLWSSWAHACQIASVVKRQGSAREQAVAAFRKGRHPVAPAFVAWRARWRLQVEARAMMRKEAFDEKRTTLPGGEVVPTMEEKLEVSGEGVGSRMIPCVQEKQREESSLFLPPLSLRPCDHLSSPPTLPSPP